MSLIIVPKYEKFRKKFNKTWKIYTLKATKVAEEVKWKLMKTWNNTGIPNVGSIPGSGWSAGEGNGNPLQYSFKKKLIYLF